MIFFESLLIPSSFLLFNLLITSFSSLSFFLFEFPVRFESELIFPFDELVSSSLIKFSLSILVIKEFDRNLFLKFWKF